MGLTDLVLVIGLARRQGRQRAFLVFERFESCARFDLILELDEGDPNVGRQAFVAEDLALLIPEPDGVWHGVPSFVQATIRRRISPQVSLSPSRATVRTL